MRDGSIGPGGIGGTGITDYIHHNANVALLPFALSLYDQSTVNNPIFTH